MSKDQIPFSASDTNTTTNSTSSIASLFDESTHEQQQQPSGYSSRNDRRPSSSDNNDSKYYRDADDQRRTVTMITFCFVCMVLYIGFCAFYHKKKKVDREGGGLSRREQLRENQNVLDESIAATRRAQVDSLAMIKYKQRKLDVEQALFIRLIVDNSNDTWGSPAGKVAVDGLEVIDDAASHPTPHRHKQHLITTDENECNICLTPFQVGDIVAWSMQYGELAMPLLTCRSGGMTMMTMSKCDTSTFSSGISNNHHCGAVSSSANEDVCKHVFHEQCISRWLLVRDGCPTCRRSYFPATTTTMMTAAASSTPPENETIDLEQGVNAVSVIEGYESD